MKRITVEEFTDRVGENTDIIRKNHGGFLSSKEEMALSIAAIICTTVDELNEIREELES